MWWRIVRRAGRRSDPAIPPRQLCHRHSPFTSAGRRRVSDSSVSRRRRGRAPLPPSTAGMVLGDPFPIPLPGGEIVSFLVSFVFSALPAVGSACSMVSSRACNLSTAGWRTSAVPGRGWRGVAVQVEDRVEPFSVFWFDEISPVDRAVRVHLAVVVVEVLEKILAERFAVTRSRELFRAIRHWRSDSPGQRRR